MRYYRKAPPPVLEKLVIPKLHAVFPSNFEAPAPDYDAVCEREFYKRFQFVYEEPLKHRYRDPYMVYEGHNCFRVKDELPPPPKVEIPPKERELLWKLKNLAEHPTAGEHERKSAFDKMRRIMARLDGAEYEVDDEFLSIDRTELFLENVEALCGGDCGLAMYGLWGDRRYDLFIYGKEFETVDRFTRQAQRASDWYLRVPKMLSNDPGERPLSSVFFEERSVSKNGKTNKTRRNVGCKKGVYTGRDY